MKKDEETEELISSHPKTPLSPVILRRGGTKNLVVPASPEILRFTQNDNVAFPDGN
jgi:hypothetical protein